MASTRAHFYRCYMTKAGDYHGLLGRVLDLLVRVHSQWSQSTFGTDAERGPIGALKHLEKEAREAQENPTDRSEYADCLLLILDASRRAGMHIAELISAAADKMEINVGRKWPAPSNTDESTEHIKG